MVCFVASEFYVPQGEPGEQKQAKTSNGEAPVSLLKEYQRDQGSLAIADQAIWVAGGALRALNYKRHCRGKSGGGYWGSKSDRKLSRTKLITARFTRTQIPQEAEFYGIGLGYPRVGGRSGGGPSDTKLL